jgi:hypothetical protein
MYGTIASGRACAMTPYASPAMIILICRKVPGERHCMARRPRDQLFKKTDVLRLIETAERKGLNDYRIEIERNHLSLIIGEGAKASDVERNALDNWMAKHHANQTEGD